MNSSFSKKFYPPFPVGKRIKIAFPYLSNMDSTQAKMLLPAGGLLEFLGVLTLITNKGMLVPKVDLGFQIPAILPADIQGMALLIIGGLTTFYALKNMQ